MTGHWGILPGSDALKPTYSSLGISQNGQSVWMSISSRLRQSKSSHSKSGDDLHSNKDEFRSPFDVLTFHGILSVH